MKSSRYVDVLKLFIYIYNAYIICKTELQENEILLLLILLILIKQLFFS